jgi:hypothetical protein
MVPSVRSDPRVDRVLRELPDETRAVARTLAKMIRANAGELAETVKWGSPTWVGNGNVIFLMLYPHHVNLGFFQGATLASHFPRIEGTGKGLRHVKVPNATAAADPSLIPLIRAAVRLDQQSPRTKG